MNGACPTGQPLSSHPPRSLWSTLSPHTEPHLANGTFLRTKLSLRNRAGNSQCTCKPLAFRMPAARGLCHPRCVSWPQLRASHSVPNRTGWRQQNQRLFGFSGGSECPQALAPSTTNATACPKPQAVLGAAFYDGRDNPPAVTTQHRDRQVPRALPGNSNAGGADPASGSQQVRLDSQSKRPQRAAPLRLCPQMVPSTPKCHETSLCN